MNRTFIVLICIALFGYQHTQAQPATTKSPDQTTPSFPSGEQYKNANITYRIIAAANHTWCYDILAEGRLMIHQPSAPGLPGNEGFKTKAKAAKVAGLVVEKIKNGEMPPSVTMDEMKKIGAL